MSALSDELKSPPPPSGNVLPKSDQGHSSARIMATVSIMAGLASGVFAGVWRYDRGDPFPFLKLVILPLLGISILVSVVCGLAAFVGARKQNDKHSRRLAIIGLLFFAWWPIAINSVYGYWTYQSRKKDSAMFQNYETKIAADIAQWKKQFPGGTTSPPQYWRNTLLFKTSFNYFGEGFLHSKTFNDNAACIIVLAAPDPAGHNGTLMAFADGHWEFVPSDNVDAILQVDDKARIAIGVPPIYNEPGTIWPPDLKPSGRNTLTWRQKQEVLQNAVFQKADGTQFRATP
jgi:hypothetical protein